jgi:5-methylcytosine-specific restriction protein B
MKINVTKEAILHAIDLVDSDPKLLRGRYSSTYDLFYKGKTYPPILVLSEANKIVGGGELKHTDFKNVQEAFKILNDFGFEVRSKEGLSLKDRLLRFSELYDEDRRQKFSKSLESF